MKKHNCSLNDRRYTQKFMLATASVALVLGGTIADATATEPCGDFGECRAIVEINATDGDIGFHWKADGDDLNSTTITDPNGDEVFSNEAAGPLLEQKLTETFGESAEPPCFVCDPEDLECDHADEDVVTLEDFRERWDEGTYTVSGTDDDGMLSGATELTYYLPAAPADVSYKNGKITWEAGDDLGECAGYDDLVELVDGGLLPEHPEDVPVLAWEIVLEPDVDPADQRNGIKFSTRVRGDIAKKTVKVPVNYLKSLGPDTPVKVEVGAIGGDFTVDEDGLVDGDADNATFSEEDGFCVNETPEGCD